MSRINAAGPGRPTLPLNHSAPTNYVELIYQIISCVNILYYPRDPSTFSEGTWTLQTYVRYTRKPSTTSHPRPPRLFERTTRPPAAEGARSGSMLPCFMGMSSAKAIETNESPSPHMQFRHADQQKYKKTNEFRTWLGLELLSIQSSEGILTRPFIPAIPRALWLATSFDSCWATWRDSSHQKKTLGEHRVWSFGKTGNPWDTHGVEKGGTFGTTKSTCQPRSCAFNTN